VLCLAAGAQSQVLPLEGMHGLSAVHRYQLEPEGLGTTYTVLVRLPESIVSEDPDSGTPLPVVYLLDGGTTFPALGAYYRYLRRAEDIPAMILVGISYGTDDWRQGNQRSRDFTAPAAEREHWGGADAFFDFLASEVFPLIESTYPADPERRVLFGQSIGGQGVLFAAQRRPGLFWGHIASNPALHRNLDFFLTALPDPRGPGAARSKLFVSSASGDDPRFREPALAWIEHWTTSAHDWVLETRTLEGHNHFSVLPEAFRQGLGWLFEESAR
jgi:predicted alpha/beta superfamily hydrolase